MIPRLKPTQGIEELLAIASPSSNKDIEEFESSFAKLMGAKYAIAFPYGRTGLVFLLKALGIENKEIICPAYTCVVVPHAIITSGNEPVFIDCCEEDFNMNLDIAEGAINQNTGAIIVTSIFGYPVNLNRLDQIREKYPKLIIIQDCAHSFSADWKGRPVQKAGDAAIFGLNISKMIHSIFGGMVITDRDDIAKRLYEIRDEHIVKPSWTKELKRRFYLFAVYFAFSDLFYSSVNVLERSGIINRFVKYYDESIIDMPSDFLIGMTGVEAKVGKIQIKRYNQIVENRRKVAEYYNQHLQNLGNLILPPIIEGATYSHYVPRMDKRDDLIVFARKRGVQLGRLIEYSIPEMESYRNRIGSRYPCPIARKISEETINLPVWINNSKYMTIVVNVIKKFFEQEN